MEAPNEMLTPAAPDASETNPLASSGGRFQDDPFWEQMQDSIRQHRREMDAEWDVPEQYTGFAAMPFLFYEIKKELQFK